MQNTQQLLSLIQQIQPSTPNFKKIRTKKIISPWTKEEDQKLLKGIELYGLHQWNLISEIVGNRTSKQCKERYFNHLDPNIVRKPWTDEELYAKYGLTQEEIDFIESMIKPME